MTLKPLKLLIVKPSSFGDIIHGLHIAQALRNGLPNVHISWIARDIYVPLVQMATCVDHIYTFDRYGSLWRFIQMMRDVRKTEFDCAIDLQGLFRSGIMTGFAKAKLKIGRKDSQEFAWCAYKRTMPLPPKHPKCHALDILAEVLPLFKLERTLPTIQFKDTQLSPGIPQSLVDGSTAPIIIFPVSRGDSKNWPFYKDLTERLLKAHPNTPIVWADNEAPEVPPGIQAPNFINIMGCTQMTDLVPLLSKARLCIANDSGPMHLSASLGTPTLGLFGPTKPYNFGPYPLDCPTNHYIESPSWYMNHLLLEPVWKKVQSILG